jgi:hypothetical protein
LIQVSNRYVFHLAVVMVLALGLFLVFRTGRLRDDACLQPDLLLSVASSSASDVNGTLWQERLERLRTARWSLREVAAEEPGFRLHGIVVESWNPGLLYLEPEMYLVAGGPSDEHDIEILEVGTERLPMHRVRFENSRRRNQPATVVGYLLLLGSQPVESPLRSGLLAAPAQLFRGRLPVWLLAVFGEAPWPQRRKAESRVKETLAQLWLEYRAACGS